MTRPPAWPATALLAAEDATDPAVVGHKFARLAALRGAGLPVPDFVCLPAAAFDLALAAVAPARPPAGAGAAAVVRWCTAAAAALRAAPVPPCLAGDVLTAHVALTGGAPAAVRACAVGAGAGDGGEDGAGDPFAGLTESFLAVPVADVLRRVADCWASAFTPHGVRYRLSRGLDPTRTRVAVGIQRMAPAARSFVAFTRDPRDGRPHTVVAAAYGLGEGVVAERADVDHFFVAGAAIAAQTVHKRRMVVRDPGGSLRVLPVPAELAERPVLDEAACRRVAELASRAERLFGEPQDVEGVLTATGEVLLVQSRPVAASRPARTAYWSDHNITESYPSVSSALTVTVAREFYRRAFGDLYRRMGVPARRLRPYRHLLDQMVGQVDGRVRYRLDAWQRLHSTIPVFELARPVWEQVMGVPAELARPAPVSRCRTLAALPGTLARMAAQPVQVRSFLRWWDGLYEAAGDLGGTGPQRLVEFYRSMWTEVGARWGVTLTASVHGLLAVRLLESLARRWAGADPELLLPSLLVGGPDSRSVRAVRSAVALAEQVAARDELAAAVRGGDPAAVWADLVGGRYGTDVAASAVEHLGRYGDRGPHDLKVEEATARQRPELLLDLVRHYLAEGLTVAGMRAAERVAARRAAADVARACPRWGRRAVLGTVARAARWHVRVREDTRFCRTQLYGLSREVLWRLGAELAASGLLDRPDDVADLTVDEVLGAFDGTAPGGELRGLAAVRRAARERSAAAAPGPHVLAVPPDRPYPAVTAAGSAPADGPAVGGTLLRGLGSSAGVARGRARVVLDPAVPPGSCRGAILVARETDPGWLYLMMSARGLVSERGTMLSHTAITGRLLGLPTVVAVDGATERIADGVPIEIDGTAGTVRLLSGEEPE